VTIAVDDVRSQSDAPRTRTIPEAVLAELRVRAGGARVVVVTVGELAAAAGVTERSVRRATARLLAAGSLQVEPGRGAANRYVLP